MCKGGYLVFNSYFKKKNKTCLLDFEDVKVFLKLLKKVLSMKNNFSHKFFSNNPENEDIMLTNYMLIIKKKLKSKQYN